jgi:glutamate/tyrosine decarboxylase-like PLP-dependent enzyme
MSIPKAAALLGLGYEAVRSISVDDHFRMIPEELERAIAADLADGKRPLAVVASAGTIATGSIDPFE